MRSIVVLPQPEGPTIAKNVPSSMSSDTSSIATSDRKPLDQVLDADLDRPLAGASPAALTCPLSIG